jgi:uncharacterized glyoxalase superfamily protein PhnB
MPKISIEQLDQVITAVLGQSKAPLLADPDLARYVRIATELRDLPKADFRVRLKDELERMAIMTKSKTASSRKQESPETESQITSSDSSKSVREGFHTITPYLAVRQAPELIEFVKEAFGAEGHIYGIGSQGGLHAEYKIGDSIIMIGGGEEWRGTPMPTALHTYVDDVDAVYQRALDAGATSMVEPLEDHGERLAGVKDVAGNEWYIAKRLSGSHTDEGLHTVNVYLHPLGAAEMIEFLKPAFAGEEVAVYRPEPGGPVVHAKVKIGNSVLEMGEAHGPYQPMPTMFFLYVDDVDAWYQRAVASGATSTSEPTNQAYGDRVASVTDPFGNTWYIATHVSRT